MALRLSIWCAFRNSGAEKIDYRNNDDASEKRRSDDRNGIYITDNHPDEQEIVKKAIEIRDNLPKELQIKTPR